MYASPATAAGAAGSLALTGATTGSLVLIGAALLVAGGALFSLFRRGGNHRP